MGASSSESGLPNREVASLEGRVGILEAVSEERHRQYLGMFAAFEASVKASIDSARAAVSKAEAATEERFKGVNEFRAALGDQATRLMPRSEADQQATALGARIDAVKEVQQLLQTQLTTLQAKSQGLQAGWGYLIGAIGGVGGLVALFAYLSKGTPP